ncbi:hypothetical protein L208DRAFT_1420398 [Tricholoma matsutake]|nr:hypothetical protein L208DRAFT_1420398 [Tricholoma matsutake 945]
MVLCSECGINFPMLSVPEPVPLVLSPPLCKKCMKLLNATSEAEHKAAKAEPQCAGCGFYCGGCEAKDKGSNVERKVSVFLQQHASEHQLNQSSGRQNPERLATLKKQSKADMVMVEMSLFMQILPLPKKFVGSDYTMDVFQYAKTELKNELTTLPASHQVNVSLLNFEEPIFGVAIGSKVHNINLKKNQYCRTINTMFNHFEGDVKNKNIPLHVFVHKTHPALKIQYDRYEFTSTTFTVDHVAMTIKISCDWRQNMGDKPKGGYLAKGLMKYAFMLILYPGIHWNFADAFIGTITSGLVFKTFLAAPLLKTSGLYNEQKFSGTGHAIDAYAHHILADSNGSLLMTDLQGVIGPDKEVILFDPQAHL